MSMPPDSKTTLPRKYSALIFLALVAAGLAGNYFKYELFFNIEFIFGSIFALLALQILGLGPGILAAALISSMTYLSWNHPYAIVIMTFEIITIGWLTRRKGLGMALSCAIYWLCLGMPLAYLFYHGVMHLPVNNTLITMVKQALNGISNALVAGMIFMTLSILSRRRRFAFREIIFHLLALFVLGPSLFVLTLECRTDFTETNNAIQASLTHSGSRSDYNLEQWLQGHLSHLSHLAKMALTNVSDSIQHGIEETHAENKDFQRIGLLDKTATVVAISPVVDEVGQPNLGRNFADRPFIPILKQNLKPMLSEVVMGRIDKPQPVVSVLAPVVRNGVYDGYVIGVLNLEGLKRVIEIETADQGMGYILLDRNGKVIISSRQDLKPMETFTREPGDLLPFANGVSRWVPLANKNISTSDRWQRSLYIAETSIGSMSEWKLILEQPVAPFQAKLFHRYADKLGVLLLILLLALTLAELFSRKIIKTQEKLSMLTTDLPTKLLSGQDIAWPESTVVETASLLANFKDMALALSEKFDAINELNANLESRVQERTAEREQFYTFFQTSTDMMCIADPNGTFKKTNPAWTEQLGYSEEELVARPFIDFVHPDDKQPTLDEMARQIHLGFTLNFENRYLCKDGSYRWLSWRAKHNKDEGITYATARDITERKEAEEALLSASLYSRNLIETSLDPMVTINTEGRITDVNAATEKITGISREKLIGSDFAEYVTEPEMARAGYLKAFAQGKIIDFPLAVRHTSGTITEVLYNATVYKNEQGKVLGIFAAARDITQRKQAEEAVHRSLKEKEVMLKEIHHRVKNNMQVVYSLLNLQAKGIADPAVRAMFEESRNRVSSMALIHEKLYRSADLAFVDFKEYLQSLVVGIAATYNRPDVLLIVDMEPLALDINVGIPCGLIVNELVSNSLKHAFPKGRGGTITLGVSKDSTGQNVLTTRDNGIGFPAELDFKNTTSLGMQLVTVLTGQLNGAIELLRDAGTKFTITFPGG